MNLLQSGVFTIALLAGCNFAAACGHGQSFTKQDALRDPQQEIAFLTKQIEMERVTSLEILNTPADVDTSSSMTPERLQKGYYCKLTVSQFGLRRESASLIAALKHTRATRVKGGADLRWGILFTLNSGIVEAVYLDGFGKRGQIDAIPVTFEGELHKWLQNLAPCMK
jgi:hypothetical protein